jgi:pyrimidine deaminase RibD-like protein
MPENDFDYGCMELAIAEGQKSSIENGRLHPFVGVAAAQGQTVLGAASRGETGPGEHPEYVLLERKLGQASLVGATIYTTLEPCTSRLHPRIPCTQRLIERRIALDQKVNLKANWICLGL